MATSSVIDLIEGNAAVPTAASKGLPAHSQFPRVHAGTGAEVITHEDYLAAITVAVCEQYSTTAAALSQVQLVSASGCAGAPSPHSTLQGAGKRMSRCRWLRSPRSAGSPRRRPATSFCMNLRTCWLQTPAMARRGGTRRAKLACCARARGRTLVRWRTGEKSPPPSAPRCRRYPNRPKACRPSTTTTGSGGRVPPGYGTRGGTSRGEGSGSRYLKVACQHSWAAATR